MDKFPPDQKIKNAKRKELKSKHEKTPRAKFEDPSFPESEGDRGIMRLHPQNIARQVKAPTRTGDAVTHAMSNVMKKSGMLRK